ncbi:hypothetical protein KN815_13765 [Streptomyces sp. 4503]|uniref:Transposase n=1 Tax=Streptomyces niphimycinicus TaxID=2842201 RepID=A0ABS6CE25_9ACTN|nr:hypothetical protein [Streptomyces niphimycinicus]MBU3865099.1 hypothetical protein [Streptomyces niphimycinicus]
MDLQFIGIDPDTKDGNCPAVWVDTDTKPEPELVLQDWVADRATEAQCAKKSPKPHSEAIIRIPARMVPLIREACDAAERAQL